MENRFSVQFALQHSESGTPVPPPSDPVVPVEPTPYTVRIPGQQGSGQLLSVDHTGTMTPISSMDPESGQVSSEDKAHREKRKSLTLNLPWIPSYLFYTAYGERFRNFSRCHSPRKITARESDEVSPINSPPRHGIDDGTDRNVSPSQFNLPQIFPSRSAAELDALGLWHEHHHSGRRPVSTRRLASRLSDPKSPPGGADGDNAQSSSSVLRGADGSTPRSGVSSAADSKSSLPLTGRHELGVPALPTSWNKKEHTGVKHLRITHDGCRVSFETDDKNSSSSSSSTSSLEVIALRANHSVPPLCGVYYFEIHIEAMGTEDLLGIGLCDAEAMLTKMPGLEKHSWGYHSDDGRIITCQGTAKSYGPKFGAGDVIGCGVDFHKNCVFYTKNGLPLGVAFQDVSDSTLYPNVGLKTGQIIRANFGGEEFRFDIEKYIRDEKAKVMEEVKARQSKPPQALGDQDPADFVHDLVASYFSHVGYLETAKAFQRERASNTSTTTNQPGEDAEMKEAPSSSSSSSAPDENTKDPAELEMYNRQKIRQLVLDGNIDTAIKRLQLFYPAVLENNDIMYLKLRCRKFVELVRQTIASQDVEMGDIANESDPSSSSTAGAGTSSEAVDYDKAMQAVIQYGQEMQKDYKDDSRPIVQEMLTQVFSLLAYDDPSTVPSLAYLFAKDSLVPLAEELNSEILASLGKPAVPSLQKLAQHATQLVWELSDQGISSAHLINVQDDFLDN
uniref:ARAD1C28996p n=1 Tax=Blastobotrys adeninivorans TaxID=409370 RepID=A0A060T2J0_BLAAD